MIAFKAKGTYTSGTGALSVPPPAGTVAGDILLLIVEASNVGAITIADIANWTAVTTTQNNSNYYMRVFWKIAGAGEGNVTVADAGDSQRAIMSSWSGVDVSPIHAFTVNTDGGTTYSAANPTSTVDGCMLVNCIGFYDPSGPLNNYTSWANASLASITEGHDEIDSNGIDGGIAFAYGIKEFSGAIGATTATADEALNLSASINILLAPLTAVITAPSSTTEGTPTSYSNELTPKITGTSGAAVTKYQVYIFDSGDNLIFDSGEIVESPLDYDVPLSAELEYNATYGIKIKAYDPVAGWSAFSTEHFLTCAMSAIADLTTSDVTAGIKLDWSASAGESITGYNIYRSLSTGTGFVLLDTTTGITFTVYKVASGTTYYYTVKVKEGTNESPASNEVNNSVSYSGWYLNGTVLPVKYGSYSRQRRNHSTSREIIGQTKNTVQSEGLGGNILNLTAILTSNIDVDTIEALLGDVVTLHHSAIGQWKVHLTNDPQINDNGYTQEMRLTFEEVE